jgi:hypothetical protein
MNDLSLPSLALPGMARARKKPSAQEADPAAKKSLLGKLGDSALSGLSMVGNFLDLPGSAVRDVLGGRNPFDQFASPFSDRNRTTGRDLLRNVGAAGKRDSWTNWAGGMATEIGLDPLTYLSFGASALGKGGQVARGAGLLDDVGRVAARRAGVEASKMGARTARTTTTLRNLINDGGMEAARKARTTAKAQGLKLRDIADEPLGGLAGVGLPFQDPSIILGTGPRGQQIAKGLDSAGRAARYAKIPGTEFQPLNTVARLFDSRLKDTKTPEVQAAAKTLFKRQEANVASSGLDHTKKVRELDQLGLGKQSDNRSLRTLAETKNLPSTPEGQWMAGIHKELADVRDDAANWGVNINKYDDPKAAFFPAQMTRGVQVSGRNAPSEPFSAMTRHKKGRREHFFGMEDRTGVLSDLSKDPSLNSLIDSGADLKAIEQHIKTNWGSKIPATFMPKGAAAKIAAGQVVKPKNRYSRLARMLSKMPKELREAGLFENHILDDLAKYKESVSNARDASKGVLETLAQPGFLKTGSTAARVEGTERVGDVLRKLSMFQGDEAQGALTKLLELQNGDTWKNIVATDPKTAAMMTKSMADARIPKEMADDLTRMVDGFTNPKPVGEIIKAYDSVTNLTKGMLTGPWPAFHTRNLFSGQWQNFVAGMFSPGSVKEAHSLLRGGTLKGAASIPALQKVARDRGITALDDTEATKLLRDLAYSYRVTGKGELDNAVGALKGDPATIDAVRAGMPGEVPQRFSRVKDKLLGRGTTWNPLDVRGVGGRTESKFAPAAAGDELGYYVEGLNRLAPFIEQLKKGVDPAEAAKKIGAAQVNYQSKYYTKAETEVLGRLFPFYKFTSRNIPFTLQQLAEKPGGRMSQTIRAANRARNPDESTPDYVSETASIPLGKAADGTARYLTGLGLAMEDPLSLVGGPRSTGLELLSRLNPMLKGPLEYATGESFFQKGPEGGRNLSDMDPTIGRLAANLTGQKQAMRIPGGEILDTAVNNSPFSRVLSTLRVATDNRKGPLAKLFNLGTGFKVSDISPGAQDAVLRERGQAMEKKLGFNEFVRMHLPEAERETMSKGEREMADALLALDRELAIRAKGRKKDREKSRN